MKETPCKINHARTIEVIEINLGGEHHYYTLEGRFIGSFLRVPLGSTMDLGQGWTADVGLAPQCSSAYVKHTKPRSSPIPEADVIEALKLGSKTPREVASVLGVKPTSMASKLTRMAKAGKIERVRHGVYGVKS